MNNKIISALVILCIVVCTIVIYNLAFSVHAKLFYINVVTACVCEVILLANIPLWASQRLLTFKNAAMSYVLDAYAIVLFLWTAVFSFFVEDEGDITTLYIGMLVTTVIFVAAFGMVAKGGSAMEEEAAVQEAVAGYKKQCLVSLENYRLKAKELLAADGSEWKEDTLRTLNLTLDKIASIPTYKLDRSENFVSETNSRLEEIKDMLARQAGNGDDASALRAETTRKIEQLKNYVTTIKTSL